MKPEIRLIASDLDGTLLLDGAQSLRPETCRLIHSLTARGIYFFAASGRQYPNLQRLFAPVKNEIGYICENGCLSFFQGEQIYKETMPRELGQEIMKRFADAMSEVANVEKPAKLEGRTMLMFLAPKPAK